MERSKAKAILQLERYALFASPSDLPEPTKRSLIDGLNARLADGIDLYAIVKGAHWNLKGPQFAALHPFFENIASDVSEANDDLAERAVTLGGKAIGDIRQAVAMSVLTPIATDVVQGIDFVTQLAERVEVYLKGLRATRAVAEGEDDLDTLDMLTGFITTFEKHGWFLRATLEK